ncbi:timeless-interacting protein [Guillardia theta CCMP2712]|uniref:Timeless-interacting protein n=1 Tax=Guillardia theta (strain CCMP2712) TaxID=905079 RepID=L1JAW2_GUITC|nr:timeless-interacting protein [Guillardia theta CCMP2712]EKX45678.1 timeless-interacting protein [Guillardia theta CCMP2712]|eukprot:XP_005832658.1 timeless-interacting protein [Guillardia theta CCMP2712]
MAFARTAHSYMPFAELGKMLSQEKASKTGQERKDLSSFLPAQAFQEKLISPDGLTKLYRIFRDTKFKGKGHEKTDLKLMMSKYQEWAYQLCPALSFDDVIFKVESVGNTFMIQRALDAYREVEADKYKEDKDGKESAGESTAFEAGPVEDQEQQKHAGTGSEAPQAMVSLEEDDDEEPEDPNQYMQQEEWQEDVAAEYVEEESSAERNSDEKPASSISDDVLKRIEENRLRAKKRLEALQAQGSTGATDEGSEEREADNPPELAEQQTNDGDEWQEDEGAAYVGESDEENKSDITFETPSKDVQPPLSLCSPQPSAASLSVGKSVAKSPAGVRDAEVQECTTSKEEKKEEEDASAEILLLHEAESQQTDSAKDVEASLPGKDLVSDETVQVERAEPDAPVAVNDNELTEDEEDLVEDVI